MNSLNYHCSACNGQVSKESRVCPHCRALLSGIRCSLCHFVGSESAFFGDKCPKCGSHSISSFGNSGRSVHVSKPDFSLSEDVWPFFINLFHSAKCLIQLHKWDGCECEYCDKTKHTWSSDDCEKCSVCSHTRSNAHKWKGCKCVVCGKTRDSNHDWSKDCNYCNSCGAVRSDFHKWNGCNCSICGKTNHDNHIWDNQNKICTVCGISEIESLVANMTSLVKEERYNRAKNELDKLESLYGSNIELQLFRIKILIGMSKKRELTELERLMGMHLSYNFNELREAFGIVQNIQNQSFEHVNHTKQNLAVALVNSGIEYINSIKPFIPYGSCGDLVYEAKSKHRRACKDALELVEMALQLDPNNKKISEIHKDISKLI